MAGINFNQLPKDIQAKLQPYMSMAKSVEDAIAMARQNGVQIDLDGGANWGKTMDEYAFNSSKAAEYKANMPKAEKEQQLAKARRRISFENDYPEKQKAWRTAGKVLGGAVAVVGTAAAVAGGIAATAGAIATAPAWAPWAAVGGGVLFLASCSKIEQDQDVVVNIPDNQAELREIIKYLKDMNTKLDNIDASVRKGFTNVVTNLNFMVEHGATQEQLDAAFNDIKNLLNQVIAANLKINADNNANAEAILKKLDAIMNSGKSINDKLTDVLKLLNSIKSIGEDISAKLDKIINQLAESLDNDQTIIAALNKLDKNDEKTLNVLNQIYAAINGLGGEFKQYFKDIIVQLSNGNMKLDDITALLKVINENVAGIKKLVAKYGDDILAALKNISALITKYGDKGAELGDAILNAIGKINVSADVDLSGIEALLNQLVKGQKQNGDKIDNLTAAFNKFSGATLEKLDVIISKLDPNSKDYTEQINNIISMLEAIDANNDKRTQKILDAINKLGVKAGDMFATLLAKLDKTAPDYSAKLDKIIELIDRLDQNNEVRNQKVLDAISKLGFEVTNSLNAILDAIKALPNGKDYESILNRILSKLGDIDANNNANFKKVLDALGKLGHGESKDVDLQPILDKLQEILEAIKDHKVVVDVTGKVTCECNCGAGEDVHEGIIGQLDGIIG